MRRALPLFALFTLAMPASWASGHAHSAMAVHAHVLSPAVTIHTHAPSIFPKAHLLGEPDGINTNTAHESTFAGFVVRTMLGFSARFSH